MKTKTLLYSLQFISFFLVSGLLHAVSVDPFGNDPNSLVLVAEKRGRTKFYTLGESVRIEYNSDNSKIRLKGFITRISDNSVEISQFGGKLVSTRLDTSSIITVTKLKRKQRKTIGIITGMIALMLATLATLTRGSIFTSAPGFAVVVIPAIAAGYILLLYLGATYLTQLLNKCSAKKGWKFYTGDRPSL
jgi:hypothetical protein